MKVSEMELLSDHAQQMWVQQLLLSRPPPPRRRIVLNASQSASQMEADDQMQLGVMSQPMPEVPRPPAPFPIVQPLDQLILAW